MRKMRQNGRSVAFFALAWMPAQGVAGWLGGQILRVMSHLPGALVPLSNKLYEWLILAVGVLLFGALVYLELKSCGGLGSISASAVHKIVAELPRVSPVETKALLAV